MVGEDLCPALDRPTQAVNAVLDHRQQFLHALAQVPIAATCLLVLRGVAELGHLCEPIRGEPVERDRQLSHRHLDPPADRGQIRRVEGKLLPTSRSRIDHQLVTPRISRSPCAPAPTVCVIDERQATVTSP
ncbi:MAG: hypothetical protein DLM58_05635 [Pseudonocardiales bacterium]|nr:MAG: hypothetical protein DLM58_05635 [Pseudonocardiales bacterium]